MKSAARIRLPGSRGWKTSARSNQQPGVLAHLAAVLVSDETADRGSSGRNAASLPSKSELCSKQYLDEDDKHKSATMALASNPLEPIRITGMKRRKKRR